VAVLDLSTGQQKVLIRGGSQAEYVGSLAGARDRGYLVYGAAGTLRAIRFDPESLEVQGDAVPVVDHVAMGSNGSAQFAVSGAGGLTYAPGGYNTEGVKRSIVWLDRKGQEEPTKAPLREYNSLRLSPDGGRLATHITAVNNADIWVWQFKGETLTKLTLEGTGNTAPVWTPDSRRIVFRSNRAGADFQLFWQAADGTGTVEQLTTEATNHAAAGFAGPNQLLFMEYGKNNSTDLAMMTMDKRQKTSLVATPFEERNPTVSPDGRFMAYESLEGGRAQIFVTTFPDLNGGRWQISTDGGIKPAWSSDGKELFYERTPVGVPASELYVVTIATTPAFSHTNPVKLFDLRIILNQAGSRSWDVSRDARRFIAIKGEATTAAQVAGADRPSFVFIVNFAEELRLKLNR